MTRMRALPRLLAAASGTRVAYAALTGPQPQGEKTWTRTNHRGEPVTLLEGPAVTVAAVGAALAVPGLDARSRLALSVAAAGAGAFGCYDDLAGGNDRRGFRGHLGAMARGEITTGAVKIAGIGAAGLAAALLLDGRDRDLDSASASGAAPALGRLADVRRLPRRPARQPRCCQKTSANGRCLATAARTRSARCSASQQRRCLDRLASSGSAPWRPSPLPARRSASPRSSRARRR